MNSTDNDDLQAHRNDQIWQDGGSDETVVDDICNFFEVRSANSSSTSQYQDVNHTVDSTKVHHAGNIQTLTGSCKSNENPVSIFASASTASGKIVTFDVGASAPTQPTSSDVGDYAPTQSTTSSVGASAPTQPTTIPLLVLQPPVAIIIASANQNVILENPQVPQSCAQTAGVPASETGLVAYTPSTSKARKRRSDQTKFDDPALVTSTPSTSNIKKRRSNERKLDDPVLEEMRQHAKEKAQKWRDDDKQKKVKMAMDLEKSWANVKRLETENQDLKLENVELKEESQRQGTENQALKLENVELKEESQRQGTENQALKLENVELKEESQRQGPENQALKLEIGELKEEIQRQKLENVKIKEKLQILEANLVCEIYGRKNLNTENKELKRKVEALTRQNALGLLTSENLALINFDVTHDLLE